MSSYFLVSYFNYFELFVKETGVLFEVTGIVTLF